LHQQNSQIKYNGIPPIALPVLNIVLIIFEKDALITIKVCPSSIHIPFPLTEKSKTTTQKANINTENHEIVLSAFMVFLLHIDVPNCCLIIYTNQRVNGLNVTKLGRVVKEMVSKINMAYPTLA
jgi:hypothetical protein